MYQHHSLVPRLLSGFFTCVEKPGDEATNITCHEQIILDYCQGQIIMAFNFHTCVCHHS